MSRQPSERVFVAAPDANKSSAVQTANPSVGDDELQRRLGRAAGPLKVFTLLCKYNSDARKQDEDQTTLTYYHSTKEPPMTLQQYLERIMRYSECGPEGILLALRLAGRCHNSKGVTLTRLSAHRLTITSLTLGVKMHCDVFRSNRTVAKAGGLELKELNGLEYAMFRELDYRTVVTNEEMEHMEACCTRSLELFAAGAPAAAVKLAEAAFCGEASADALKEPPVVACTTMPPVSPLKPSSWNSAISEDSLRREDSERRVPMELAPSISPEAAYKPSSIISSGSTTSRVDDKGAQQESRDHLR
jgi:hypothetical protein